MLSVTSRERAAEVRWRGEIVGRVTGAVTDMWYLDGVWAPAPTATAAEFSAKAVRLDPKQVMRDETLGFRVELDVDGARMAALVLSLSGGRLLVRCVHDEPAVAWLLANVAE